MLPSAGGERCPDCGAELRTDPSVPGLCPQCLLSLALRDEKAQDEAETIPPAPLAAGRILGERYQLRELLGRGGMGEVFRAFDLKLRVDVALKSVRPDRADGDRSQELLRQEVRAAREVISPNVCRIFDLVVEDAREFVSMEYIEGATLADTMAGSGPLPLKRAREIAAQFLSGLEAIHAAGLVHRDFKPENVMITRAGRVVVMDFGLARAWTTSRSDTVSGTPAYMAPEQLRADAIDARADVFAAAIVLAEMLNVGGKDCLASRQALWRAVREAPPRLPESPWAPALQQALSPDPAARQASARVLARALEEVTLRRPGIDERRPYPGLSSFTSADAEYFFGREPDVEGILQKLKRPRMLALVGPSGAGKTSFLRAGLLPRLPASWGPIIATPGHRPFQALAQAIAASVAGDADAVQQLLRFDDIDTAVAIFRRFRGRHAHALVVLDQFEELFTLSSPDTRAAFASLLGRLVLEADCHVILSLRDDFLLHCNAHAPLAPAFSDLTPLGALGENALRRALVQPALACGYQFEDEALVDEMVGSVSGERGALPLLAFAASRLWEQRDRERGLLTRRAYHEIGGVGGALAQHAEATLGRVGSAREPIVREIFRNLVTAQGTRAVRDRDELLSVFPVDGPPGSGTRAEAMEVLDALVGARLLTTYEPPGELAVGGQQIEIVHESLLQAWPRLVRWQTQDADGAQLRHQLRQAAQLWDERGRAEDLLWSGTAFRDFTLWRERYAGGLTSVEEAFADAASRRAGRRRRRRALAWAAAFTATLVIALGAAVLWLQAERARQRAEAEILRAEAGKLLVLAERDVDQHPTGALAYAIKSLELADTPTGRLLALRVLQRSPVARVAPIPPTSALLRAFSPDGEWLAVGGFDSVRVFHRNGGEPRLLVQYPSRGLSLVGVQFRSSNELVTDLRGDVRLWSLPEGRELMQVHLDRAYAHFTSRGILVENFADEAHSEESLALWPFTSNGSLTSLGRMRVPDSDSAGGNTLAYSQGKKIFVRAVDDSSAPARLLTERAVPAEDLLLNEGGTRLAVAAGHGRVELWPVAAAASAPDRVLQLPGDTAGVSLDTSGQRLAAADVVDGRPTVRVYDLAGPVGSEPLVITRGESLGHSNAGVFDPSGQWLSTASGDDAEMWWLGGLRPRVLREGDRNTTDLVFTPDGRSLIAAFGDGLIRAYPMAAGEAPRTIFEQRTNWRNVMAIDPAGRRVAAGFAAGRLFLVDFKTGASRPLSGFSERTAIGALAFDDTGRLLAAAPLLGPRADKVIRVFDLEDGSVRTFGPLPGTSDGQAGGIRGLTFAGTATLLALVEGAGMVAIDLENGAARAIAGSPNSRIQLARDGGSGVGLQLPRPGATAQVVPFGLREGSATALSGFERPVEVAFEPLARLVATGDLDGTVRVARMNGGDPHILAGHGGAIQALAFSPDGRWLASSSTDSTIRIWRVPDVSRTPVHRLSHKALLDRLAAYTNLRAVPDNSDTGYTLKPGPFPGWATPPPD